MAKPPSVWAGARANFLPDSKAFSAVGRDVLRCLRASLRIRAEAVVSGSWVWHGKVEMVEKSALLRASAAAAQTWPTSQAGAKRWEAGRRLAGLGLANSGKTQVPVPRRTA